MVPSHTLPLVHQHSPYWKFIRLNFQVASPRSFNICLRIHIPGKQCDVSSTSRSGRRAWPLADQHQWGKNTSPCPGIYQPRWHLGWSEWLRVQGKEAQENLRRGSVQVSCSVVSDSLRPHGMQHARLPCPSPTPRVYSNSCPSSRWCHQPSHPLSSPSPPAFNLSQDQGLFKWVSSSHQVAKVLEFQLQHQSFQWTPRTDLL